MMGNFGISILYAGNATIVLAKIEKCQCDSRHDILHIFFFFFFFFFF